jgi:hypothetical protein
MARTFKHQNMRTWELAVDAIHQLGGHATAKEIFTYIQKHASNYNPSNLHVDLCFVSVNCASRVNHSQNKKPRRSDSGSEYDALYKEGHRTNVTYHIYDPDKHGIWEIAKTSEGELQVRRLEDSPSELEKIQADMESTGAFDPTNIVDARRRIIAAIVSRRGQHVFRRSLFSAYKGRCAITNCNVADVLEAAHILPYQGPHTNDISNGLLLRADIHTLFDLELLRIHPTNLTVELSGKLHGTQYSVLDGKRVFQPENMGWRASRQALDKKYSGK